jgi:hypothetical protein
VVGLRKDMSLECSAHAGFASDTTYYRRLLCVDGQSTWRQAVTPRNGGDTLSPFVTLAAGS